MEVCAVKALGGDWRQKYSPSDGSKTRGKGSGKGKSKGKSNLICAKQGCSQKLSKGIAKRAEKWAEDTGKDVSKHLCLCYKHYKEMVANDLAGIEDAMCVVLADNRKVTFSRKKAEYHACKRTLEKESKKDKEKAPDKPPAADPAEFAEATAMLVKILRAAKAEPTIQETPTNEEVESPTE